MVTLIIGGGIVGLSLAFGLLKQGKKVIVLDAGDNDFRASRGNFGLIWIQGKGENCPEYAHWSRQSADLWPNYAQDLQKITGIDLSLSQKGGIEYFTDEAELLEHANKLKKLKTSLNGDYPFEILDHKATKALVPEIGSKVVGATFSSMDGHVNPLFLLRALSIAVQHLGGKIKTGVRVIDIQGSDYDFTAILANKSRITAESIVLAAGLGALKLGKKLGFKVPIHPQQGQLLITEKLPFFMHYPSGTLRQVNEGGIQIGASKANIGFNDDEDIATLTNLARHAIDVFPHLINIKIVRTWGALRIMTHDGLPIYQHSPIYKGASFVTCHSGITLSAIHAKLLPNWIMQKDNAPNLSPFSERRFNVLPT